MKIFSTLLFRIILPAILISPFVSLAYGAEKPIIDTADIGNGVGEYRFELHKIGSGDYRRDNDIDAEIRMFKKGTTTIFQRLQVTIGIDDPGFQFMDVNGDGYNDLLLYDACVGFAGCSGPSIAADVFMYAPKLKRFVKSKTLSGRGDIQISSKKGCVIANYKSGMQGYTDEEWCFNLSTGKWRMINVSGGEPEQ